MCASWLHMFSGLSLASTSTRRFCVLFDGGVLLWYADEERSHCHGGLRLVSSSSMTRGRTPCSFTVHAQDAKGTPVACRFKAPNEDSLAAWQRQLEAAIARVSERGIALQLGSALERPILMTTTL